MCHRQRRGVWGPGRTGRRTRRAACSGCRVDPVRPRGRSFFRVIRSPSSLGPMPRHRRTAGGSAKGRTLMWRSCAWPVARGAPPTSGHAPVRTPPSPLRSASRSAANGCHRPASSGRSSGGAPCRVPPNDRRYANAETRRRRTPAHASIDGSQRAAAKVYRKRIANLKHQELR